MERMHAPVRLEVVPGASHLFEEPGTLQRAAELSRDFLVDRLSTSGASGTSARAAPPEPGPEDRSAGADQVL
jgi:putative phosphoribosyl transferase